MAISREIRSKIASIKNTQKITRAMELVAASKMRKAQQRMSTSRPYASKIQQVISHIATSHSEYHHPYLKARPDTKRVGFIAVATDRGLCGGLNINLFKTMVAAMEKWRTQDVPFDLCTIGQKAEGFFRRFGGNLVASASHLGDAPKITDLIGLVKIMLNSYEAHELDGVFIAFNEFVNTMTQRPRIMQLLPIVVPPTNDMDHHWDYLYEPDARELLNVLLVRYIETQVYQAVVENIACEQAARMVAMKNATDNAGQLIGDLRLIYNKARQAAITGEIAEIVGGAAAV